MNLYIVLLCWLFSCFSNYAALAQEQRQNHPVKLGAILCLSGDLAPFGQAVQQGMQMALAESNLQDFELLYEDDQSLNRAVTLSALKKLVKIDKVPVVLSMTANNSTVIAPTLNQSKTVGLVMWDSNKKIAALGDYVFGLGYSTELAGADFAEFTVKKLGAKNVAIISVHDEWSDLYSDAFKQKIIALGAKIARHDIINLDTTDLRTILARIKTLNVDATLATLYGGPLVSWLKQSRELNMSGYLLSGDGISDNEVNEAGPKNSEGLYATQIWVDNEDFRQRYRAKYGAGSDKLNISFVSIGYDTVKCLSTLKKSIEAKGLSFNSESVRNNLIGFKCPGVTGDFSVAESRLSNRRERIVTVKAGNFQLVQ